MKKLKIVLLSLILSLGINISFTEACKPGPDAFVLENQVERAKNIFVGKILKTKDFTKLFGNFEITVQVVRPLKTDKKKGDIVTIITKSNSAACGYDELNYFAQKLDFIFFTNFNFETSSLAGNEKVHYENISDLEKKIKNILSSEKIEDPIEIKTFTDVDDFNPNAFAIAYIHEMGIVKGYDDGTFLPNNPINRAEFTKIIVESQFYDTEIEHCPVEFLKFSDVKKSDWFAKYICVAKNNGLIKGYDDGTFLPNKNILFSEASKIISQAFRFSSPEGKIWYEGFVRNLSDRAAIPLSIESVDQEITRGEMAEMIYRLKTENTLQDSQNIENIIPTCTEELKICPNGNMVERVFPSCEFRSCDE